MSNPLQYSIYHCKEHNIIIYYFKSNTHVTGKYHCWDCRHDEQKRQEKNNGNV